MGLILRKQNIKDHFDSLAKRRDSWIDKNSYFYQEDEKYMKFLKFKKLILILVILKKF